MKTLLNNGLSTGEKVTFFQAVERYAADLDHEDSDQRLDAYQKIRMIFWLWSRHSSVVDEVMRGQNTFAAAVSPLVSVNTRIKLFNLGSNYQDLAKELDHQIIENSPQLESLFALSRPLFFCRVGLTDYLLPRFKNFWNIVCACGAGWLFLIIFMLVSGVDLSFGRPILIALGLTFIMMVVLIDVYFFVFRPLVNYYRRQLALAVLDQAEFLDQIVQRIFHEAD